MLVTFTHNFELPLDKGRNEVKIYPRGRTLSVPDDIARLAINSGKALAFGVPPGVVPAAVESKVQAKTADELNSLKKDDLIKLAADRSVEIAASDSKAVIVEKLLAGEA